ncbi:MAG TPA: helical backbone metal receptor [Tepidiformaceae bacterium]|nr:helical backbone metal receptor [Tepidiformaceae bacterium]
MPPARIVSLVPSLTELVCRLGAGDHLVGRTRFCTEPAGLVEAVPIMGGTKNPHVERIVAARPDLVVANKEENRREDVEALQQAGLNVLLTDPNTVEEALAMIAGLGDILDHQAKAAGLINDVRSALAERRAPPAPRVFVAVWKDPLMGLGEHAYGHDLLERCGAVNVLAGRSRYPEVTLDEVAALHPDVILLPDEPYPFKQSHVEEFSAIAPATVIDGKLLWWYGPRMPVAIRTLRAMFVR